MLALLLFMHAAARSAVIERKRRITHCREVQIGAAVCKRILRQRAKAQPEQWIGKDDGQHAQHRCQSGRHIHQLLGRTAGAGVVPPARYCAATTAPP